MAHYIDYLPAAFEFYFGSGLDGGMGTNGYSYGYVMVRTTEDGVFEYGYSFDGYLCDHDLDYNAIDSICYSMGFYNQSAIFAWVGMTVNRQIPIALDDLECPQAYTDPAINCTYRYPYGSHNCLHDEGVWLTCDSDGQNSQGAGAAVNPVLTDGENLLEFMLTEGTRGYLYNPHGWICDHDQFDDSEAEVICYEMGLGLDHYDKGIDLDAEVDTRLLPFAVSYYPMGLDHFSCSDNPSGLTSCSYTYENDGYCFYNQGLYLDCSAQFVDLSAGTSKGLEVWIIALLLGLSIVFLLFICSFCYVVVRGKRFREQNNTKDGFDRVLSKHSVPSYGPDVASLNEQKTRDTFGADPGMLPTESWESEDPIDDSNIGVYGNTAPVAQVHLGSLPSGPKTRNTANIAKTRGEGSLIYKRPSALNTTASPNQRSNYRVHEGEVSEYNE